MPCPHKKEKNNPGKHRKHTEITSEAQQGLMGADLARLRAGEKTKTGMSEADLVAHLEESKGKDLPKRAKKSHSANEGGFLASRKAKFGVT